MPDTTDPVRQAAEKVVNQLAAWFDPDRDSDYNMGPYPDPVAALVAFADTVVQERERELIAALRLLAQPRDT
ncbi:hypothetical protein [Streptomyces hydrogenans]|uniref:Uncharacterized protein n=1 Tax=Streptomyces hydrogenans TaxID=1873719 RepID=A0ABQ3PJL3_9ACTN|nr:hypothetical protein [Streptomyces hydrogenans]GHG10063.1 hypothetical protein GCM10018784_23420 [Streptomyces hydrogenans]GHI25206.1 hypothetical protein Shyd_65770 [Streptomyces hydrogenans]